MNLWKRSLGEDAVDRCNHTWSVLLFLLLSLITWLVPLNFHQQPTEVTAKKSLTPSWQETLPQYQASCWCPSQFTGSHVTYVNDICAAAFKNAIQNNNTTSANLYYILDEPISPLDNHNSRFAPTIQKNIPRNGRNFVDTNTRAIIQDLITMTTPLMLFMFAVCLKLPHIIWHLLSSCCGTALNVDRTLQAALQGQLLSTQDRRQLNQDLAKATADTVRSSPRSASLTFVLFKVLVCVVVAVEVVVVMRVALPHVHDAKTEVIAKHSKELREAKDIFKEDEFQATDYNGIFLMCDFPIRALQNIQRFSVQCLFTIAPSASAVDSSSSGHTARSGLPSQEKTQLRLYETLLTAVLAYLILLLFVNIISTSTWISKLFLGPCRDHTMAGKDVPLDIYLLLLMSQKNAGPLVTQDLAGYPAWSSSQDPGSYLLREM